MWLKIIPLLISAGGWLFDAYQRWRLRDNVKSQIEAEQNEQLQKVVGKADAVRADADNLPDDLLLPPEQRPGFLSSLPTYIRKQQSGSGPVKNTAGFNED